MLKIILVALMPLLAVFSGGSDQSSDVLGLGGRDDNNGTLEKMVVAGGNLAMDVNLNRLNGTGTKESVPTSLRFDLERDSFFTVLVFNNELRGPLPSSMPLVPRTSGTMLPAKLNASYAQLVVEKADWGAPFDLVIRDAKTGFVFFNIEGHEYDYSAGDHSLSVNGGRVLISKEFAAELGRPGDAGAIVGIVSIAASLRTIEVTKVVDGDVKSDVLPATPSAGSVPGPDVVVGDLIGLAQFGTNGTQVGLAVGTTSCNFGTVDLDWFATPDNDHPVIPQNLYRMSGGTSNNDRFEQIGQSNVKHAFTALTQNICSLGCNGVGGTHLGSGCSDPYDANLNSGPGLGSRAWINPFTGAYPRADSATPPNNHSGHVHNAISHRILTEVSDLSSTLNPGATYFAEAQYVTPHEYVWCQAHPGQCNQYNNVSYRQYAVTGTASPFSFSAAASTVQSKPALAAWSGSTSVQLQPDPGNDGVGIVAYKVTNPSPGLWHYEYAVYNENLDRAIQSFNVAIGSSATLSNIGFHAPPQQPGWSADGTVGNTGYSSTPWTPTQAANSMTWNTETFATNQNANAIRWGTLYNFRFDSNRPPQLANATIGFFKTGAPIVIQVQAPSDPPVNVTVSGRVTTSLGRGIGYARVTITGPGSSTRTTYTSAFGYYHFDNVLTGSTYTLTAFRRHYTFTPQQLLINGNLAGVNFFAGPIN